MLSSFSRAGFFTSFLNLAGCARVALSDWRGAAPGMKIAVFATGAAFVLRAQQPEGYDPVKLLCSPGGKARIFRRMRSSVSENALSGSSNSGSKEQQDSFLRKK